MSKKKNDLHKLAAEVSKIRHQQVLDSNLFLTNKSLGKLIEWKGQKDDQKLPSKRKEDLLAQWNATKGRASPNVSLYNSTDKDSNRDETIEAQELDKEGGLKQPCKITNNTSCAHI